MKYILILFLLTSFAFGQSGILKSDLFSTSQKIVSVSENDSVYVKMGNGPYKLLTESVNDTAMITGDDKVAEGTVIFRLSGEDWWTFARTLTFQVRSTGFDTLTSETVSIPWNARGALSLYMVADTVADSTYYNNSYIEGN